VNLGLAEALNPTYDRRGATGRKALYTINSAFDIATLRAMALAVNPAERWRVQMPTKAKPGSKAKESPAEPMR
jgi:hypothetical protein